MSSTRRPSHHRRRGPDRRPLLVRWLDDVWMRRRRVARRRRLQRHVHLVAIGYAPLSILLTLLRNRLGLPPWLSLTIASGAPLAVAAALPQPLRRRWDDVHVALQGELGAARRRRARPPAAAAHRLSDPPRQRARWRRAPRPAPAAQAARRGHRLAAGRRHQHHLRLVVRAARAACLRARAPSQVP